MIMAAAVTTIVVGAGMSTAICGSIRGSQTLEVNSQSAIMTPTSARLGKYAPTRMIQTSTGLIGSGAAGSGGSGARAASMRPDTSSPASFRGGGTCLLCIRQLRRWCVSAGSRLIGLTAERPRLGQVARLGPRLRLAERRHVVIGGIRQLSDLAGPIRRQEWRVCRNGPAQPLIGAVHEAQIERFFVILRRQRLRHAVALLQPLGNARVLLAPQLGKWIAVGRLVEIIVELRLLQQQRLAIILEHRLF